MLCYIWKVYIYCITLCVECAHLLLYSVSSVCIAVYSVILQCTLYTMLHRIIIVAVCQHWMTANIYYNIIASLLVHKRQPNGFDQLKNISLITIQCVD